MESQEREVRAFIDAFNSQQLDRLAETLHPDVVVVTARGPIEGPEAAKDWARASPTGSLFQQLELDDVEVRGDLALADVRKQWHWRDAADGGLADESRYHFLAHFADGKIIRWEPYEDRAEAAAKLGSAASLRD